MATKRHDHPLPGSPAIRSRNQLLTVPEAAGNLTIRDKTLRKWLAERRLACVRLGRAVRVPASEVDRLIAEGSVPAVSRE
jgi:excisionase family DNA binding protein